MTRENKTIPRRQIERKIDFLQDQLISLDYDLPETYDFLVQELDAQKRLLAEIELKEEYEKIESDAENQVNVLRMDYILMDQQ